MEISSKVGAPQGGITMSKSARVVMLIEPILDEQFRSLAIKKGVSTSSLLRSQ